MEWEKHSSSTSGTDSNQPTWPIGSIQKISMAKAAEDAAAEVAATARAGAGANAPSAPFGRGQAAHVSSAFRMPVIITMRAQTKAVTV